MTAGRGIACNAPTGCHGVLFGYKRLTDRSLFKLAANY